MDLNAYLGQTELLIVFKAISGFGNNMYIDDINIQTSTGIGENSSTSIAVFPSLTSGDVYINLENNNSNEHVISILDVNGKLLETFNAATNNKSQVYVNLSNYSNGVYIVKVDSDSQNLIQKVVLEK